MIKFSIDASYGVLFYKMLKLIREFPHLAELRSQVIFFFTICLASLLTQDIISFSNWVFYVNEVQKD